MQLDIVTPEGKCFSDEVDLVVLSGSLGDMGILKAHAPLVSALSAGELRYTQGGKEHSLAVGAGVVEGSNNNVSVLTDMAIDEDDIDTASVNEAIERAQRELADTPADADAEKLQQLIIQGMAQLEVHRRRKGH
ncbi:MAG: ATP synthase F1 subunit epsilon [Verrucomicrobiota bacterium]